MTQFYVSDHHLLHANIIRFCRRPFADVKEMGEKILEYHNSIVRPCDHVSFLGDVTLLRGGRPEKEWFLKEMKKYHGHKRLFLGNHDHWPTEFYRQAFEKVYATWRDQQGIIYSHIPIHPSSMGTCLANVHGHIHNNQAGRFPPVLQVGKDQKVLVKPYINVSIEAINYLPISHEEIMQKVREANG